MSKKKRKIKLGRLLLLLLITLLTITMLVLLGKLIFGAFNNDEPDVPDNPIDIVEKMNIELVDYSFYKTDFDFDFAIVELKFSDTKAINYSIEDLTIGGKKLNDVSSYIKTLTDNHYDLNPLNISYEVKSNENQCQVRLFVPITKESNKALIYGKEGQLITLDLSKNNKDISDLLIKHEEEIKTESCSFVLSAAYDSDIVKQDGEEVSGAKFYIYQIQVTKIVNNAKIVEAKVVLNNGEEILAKAGNYTNKGLKNALDTNLEENKNYCLFFSIVNSDNAYSGNLLLKLSDSSEWIKVETVLD